MWWKETFKTPQAAAAEKAPKSASEIRLQALINGAASDTIVLNNSTLGSTIYLSDTIWVRRPTVYLKGGDHVTLIRHSSFGNGPAIVVTPQCQSIVLDSITLKDFGMGVLTSNPHALRLKNSRFINCAVAVGYRFVPDSSIVNGMFSNPQNSSVQPK